MADERNRRLRNQGAPPVAVGARLLRQVRDEDVSAALLLVGFLTCVTAARAATTPQAAAGRGPGVLAGALLAGGLGALWAAVWVAADAARRRDAGRLIILCAALLPMVVGAVGLCNDLLDLFFAILRAVA